MRAEPSMRTSGSSPRCSLFQIRYEPGAAGNRRGEASRSGCRSGQYIGVLILNLFSTWASRAAARQAGGKRRGEPVGNGGTPATGRGCPQPCAVDSAVVHGRAREHFCKVMTARVPDSVGVFHCAAQPPVQAVFLNTRLNKAARAALSSRPACRSSRARACWERSLSVTPSRK